MKTARYVIIGLNLAAIGGQAHAFACLDFGWFNFVAVVSCSLAVGLLAAQGHVLSIVNRS